MTREAATARVAWIAVELTDDALESLRAFAEGLDAKASNRRDLSSQGLATAQYDRDLGIVRERAPIDPDAVAFGSITAEVLAEVARATTLHGRTFPGGLGPSGSRVDQAASVAAKARCDAANRRGGASLRQVLEEEVAEVWAERAGSMLQRAELVQVAAVCLRGVATIDEQAARRVRLEEGLVCDGS